MVSYYISRLFTTCSPYLPFVILFKFTDYDDQIGINLEEIQERGIQFFREQFI